ncbi:limkain-b1-type NYN domain-containing protein, partial [Baffinella frigidus]
AVLVDAENSSWRKMGPILEEIAPFGDTTVKRVYGDFMMNSLKEWREVSEQLSIRLVTTSCHVPGKGSSDAALIIEAMDFLHTNPMLDGFAIVSSDSDFTSLAQRLREAGKHVLGFGARKTPKPFIMACDRFIYIE